MFRLLQQISDMSKDRDDVAPCSEDRSVQDSSWPPNSYPEPVLQSATDPTIPTANFQFLGTARSTSSHSIYGPQNIPLMPTLQGDFRETNQWNAHSQPTNPLSGPVDRSPFPAAESEFFDGELDNNVFQYQSYCLPGQAPSETLQSFIPADTIDSGQIPSIPLISHFNGITNTGTGDHTVVNTHNNWPQTFGQTSTHQMRDLQADNFSNNDFIVDSQGQALQLAPKGKTGILDPPMSLDMSADTHNGPHFSNNPICPSDNADDKRDCSLVSSKQLACQRLKTSYGGNDSGYHTRSNPESIDVTHFCGRRMRCIQEKRGPSSMKRDPAKPYTCTSPCGTTFKRKGDWKRHEEENNYLQTVWVCKLEVCRKGTLDNRTCYRKEHFTKHIKRNHDRHRQLTEENFNEARIAIPNNFSRDCIFKRCHRKSKSWLRWVDHVGKHMKRDDWDTSQWRSVGLSKKRKRDDTSDTSSYGDSGRESSLTSGDSDSKDGTNKPGPSYAPGDDGNTTQGPDDQSHFDQDQESHDRHGPEYYGTATTEAAPQYRNAATTQFWIFPLEQSRLALFGLESSPALELQAEPLLPNQEQSKGPSKSSVITSGDGSSGNFSAACKASSHTAYSSATPVSGSKVQLRLVAVPSGIADVASGSTAEPQIKVGLSRYLQEYDHFEAFTVGIRSSQPEYSAVTISYPDIVRLRTTHLDRWNFEAFKGDYLRRHLMFFQTELENDLFNDQLSGSVPQAKDFTKHSRAPITIREKIRAYKPTSEHPPCPSKPHRTESLVVRAASVGSDEMSQDPVEGCGSVMLQRFLNQKPAEEPFNWFLVGERPKEEVLSAVKALSLEEQGSKIKGRARKHTKQAWNTTHEESDQSVKFSTSMISGKVSTGQVPYGLFFSFWRSLLAGKPFSNAFGY